MTPPLQPPQFERLEKQLKGARVLNMSHLTVPTSEIEALLAEVARLRRIEEAARLVNDRIVIKDIGDPDFELLPGSTDVVEALADALSLVGVEDNKE